MPPKKKPVAKRAKKPVTNKKIISQNQSVVVNVNTSNRSSNTKRKARQSAPQALSFTDQLRFIHSQPTIAQPTPNKQNEQIAHTLKELSIYRRGSIDDVFNARVPVKSEANYSLYDEIDTQTNIINLADVKSISKQSDEKSTSSIDSIYTTGGIEKVADQVNKQADRIIGQSVIPKNVKITKEQHESLFGLPRMRPISENLAPDNSVFSDDTQSTKPDNSAPSLVSRSTTAQMITNNSPSRPNPIRSRNSKGQFTKKID
jgi:hypothetical protein